MLRKARTSVAKRNFADLHRQGFDDTATKKHQRNPPSKLQKKKKETATVDLDETFAYSQSSSSEDEVVSVISVEEDTKKEQEDEHIEAEESLEDQEVAKVTGASTKETFVALGEETQLPTALVQKTVLKMNPSQGNASSPLQVIDRVSPLLTPAKGDDKTSATFSSSVSLPNPPSSEQPSSILENFHSSLAKIERLASVATVLKSLYKDYIIMYNDVVNFFYTGSGKLPDAYSRASKYKKFELLNKEKCLTSWKNILEAAKTTRATLSTCSFSSVERTNAVQQFANVVQREHYASDCLTFTLKKAYYVDYYECHSLCPSVLQEIDRTEVANMMSRLEPLYICCGMYIRAREVKRKRFTYDWGGMSLPRCRQLLKAQDEWMNNWNAIERVVDLACDMVERLESEKRDVAREGEAQVKKFVDAVLKFHEELEKTSVKDHLGAFDNNARLLEVCLHQGMACLFEPVMFPVLSEDKLRIVIPFYIGEKIAIKVGKRYLMSKYSSLEDWLRPPHRLTSNGCLTFMSNKVETILKIDKAFVNSPIRSLLLRDSVLSVFLGTEMVPLNTDQEKVIRYDDCYVELLNSSVKQIRKRVLSRLVCFFSRTHALKRIAEVHSLSIGDFAGGQASGNLCTALNNDPSMLAMKFREKTFVFRWLFAELNKKIQKMEKDAPITTPKTFGDISPLHQFQMEVIINQAVTNPHGGGKYNGRFGAVESLFALVHSDRHAKNITIAKQLLPLSLRESSLPYPDEFKQMRVE